MGRSPILPGAVYLRLGTGGGAAAGLFDAPSGGNALTWSALATPVAVTRSCTVTIAAGALRIADE
nr:hypothetical protein [uncultured Roseococcus sp.]